MAGEVGEAQVIGKNDEWQKLLSALRRLNGFLHLGGETAVSEPFGSGFRVAAKVGLSGSGEGLVAKSWVADVASPGDGWFRVLLSVAVGKSFDGEIAFGGVGYGEKVFSGGDGVAVFPVIEGGIETTNKYEKALPKQLNDS